MTAKHLDDIADWAVARAWNKSYPTSARRNIEALRKYIDRFYESYLGVVALAEMIEKCEQPPVSQELLIWREAKALFEEDLGLLENAKEYREGLLDHLKVEQGSMAKAIKLALEGFGKEGAS